MKISSLFVFFITVLRSCRNSEHSAGSLLSFRRYWFCSTITIVRGFPNSTSNVKKTAPFEKQLLLVPNQE